MYILNNRRLGGKTMKKYTEPSIKVLKVDSVGEDFNTGSGSGTMPSPTNTFNVQKLNNLINN